MVVRGVLIGNILVIRAGNAMVISLCVALDSFHEVVFSYKAFRRMQCVLQQSKSSTFLPSIGFPTGSLQPRRQVIKAPWGHVESEMQLLWVKQIPC